MPNDKTVTAKKKPPTEVHVYLDPEDYRKVALLAKSEERSMTAQCRVIIKEWLNT